MAILEDEIINFWSFCNYFGIRQNEFVIDSLKFIDIDHFEWILYLEEVRTFILECFLEPSWGLKCFTLSLLGIYSLLFNIFQFSTPQNDSGWVKTALCQLQGPLLCLTLSDVNAIFKNANPSHRPLRQFAQASI